MLMNEFMDTIAPEIWPPANRTGKQDEETQPNPMVDNL